MRSRQHVRLLLACLGLPLLLGCEPDNSDPVSHVGAVESTLTLAIADTDVTLNAGESRQVQLTADDGSSVELSGLDIQWQSSDTAIASVDSDGVVLGVAPGVVDITASSGTASTAVSVTVTDAVLVGLALEPVSVEMPPCTRLDIETAGIFSNGAELAVDAAISGVSADPDIVTWESQDDGSGGALVSASPGSTTVTVSAAEFSESVPVLVTDTLVSASLENLPAWFAVGDTVALQADAHYSDGTSRAIANVGSWSIVDTDPVAILSASDSGQVLLSASTAGRVSVQWECAGQTITRELQILDTTSAGELALLVDGQPLAIDDALDLDATTPVVVSLLLRTAEGDFVDVTADASWLLMDGATEAFAIDDDEGEAVLLSAVPGQLYEARAALRFSVGDSTFTLPLVTQRDVSRVLSSVAFLIEDALGNVSELTPDSNRFVVIGDRLDLGLLLRYNLHSETLDGDAVLWSNSDPAIATIDSTGRLVAVDEGVTDIAGVHDGLIYRFTVTVVAP